MSVLFFIAILAAKLKVLLLLESHSYPCFADTTHARGASPTTATCWPFGLGTAQLTGKPKWPIVAVIADVEQLSQELSMVCDAAKARACSSSSLVIYRICNKYQEKLLVDALKNLAEDQLELS